MIQVTCRPDGRSAECLLGWRLSARRLGPGLPIECMISSCAQKPPRLIDRRGHPDSTLCKFESRLTIGIGGTITRPPFHTTGHAGPQPAVRRIKIGVNSRAFDKCVANNDSVPPQMPLELHSCLRPEGQHGSLFCRYSFLRAHSLLALSFIPLTGYRSGLRSPFPAWPICCSAFRHWSASIALPTA